MDNALSLLGLALRAGRVETGEEAVRDACRAKISRLVIVAEDAAAGTIRRAMLSAEEGKCLCLTVPYDRAEIGGALGRGLCAAAAVTDIGFAGAFAERLAAKDPVRYGPAAERLRVKAVRARERREKRDKNKANQAKKIPSRQIKQTKQTRQIKQNHPNKSNKPKR